MSLGNSKPRPLGPRSKVAVEKDVAALSNQSGTKVFAGVLTLAVLGIFGGPASAHHKPGHTQGGTEASSDNDGDADSDPGTAYTEDTDTNDGGTPNNQPDEGDNAHPSGKDRSVENGNSGNQGKSESDPDDNGKGPERTNGGPDKPNGSGGVDLADQDGNNGCGNDDDFEDDNEGWCGGKPGGETTTDTPPGDEVLKTVTDRGEPETVVAGTIAGRPATEASGAGGEELPFTGANIADYLAVALVFLIGGMLLLRAVRI